MKLKNRPKPKQNQPNPFTPNPGHEDLWPMIHELEKEMEKHMKKEMEEQMQVEER